MLRIEDIINTLDQHKSRLLEDFSVVRIGVFGSYARGDQTLQSDIDFIVEFSENLVDLFDTKYRLKLFLRDLFDKPVDLANAHALKPYVMKEIAGEVRYA